MHSIQNGVMRDSIGRIVAENKNMILMFTLKLTIRSMRKEVLEKGGI